MTLVLVTRPAGWGFPAQICNSEACPRQVGGSCPGVAPLLEAGLAA